jgi:hypothetical protein
VWRVIDETATKMQWLVYRQSATVGKFSFFSRVVLRDISAKEWGQEGRNFG